MSCAGGPHVTCERQKQPRMIPRVLFQATERKKV
jgi:hypothetical protein